MTDDQLDADRCVVYEKTTVDVDPESVDERWLADRFGESDEVRASDRVSGDWLGQIGDSVPDSLCPVCGEECHSARPIEGEMHYYHREHVDCERDVRDKLRGATTATRQRPSLKRRLANLAIGSATALGAAWFVFNSFPTSEMTVNGDPVQVPPQAGFEVVAAIVLLATLFVAFIQFGPGVARGGRR